MISSGRSDQKVRCGIISFPSLPRIRLNKHPRMKYNNNPGKNLKANKQRAEMTYLMNTYTILMKTLFK